MVYLWAIHAQLRNSHGVLMGYPWVANGLPIDYLRLPLGDRCAIIKPSWDTHGLPGLPMGYRWAGTNF